jgi:hypothetical protein
MVEVSFNHSNSLASKKKLHLPLFKIRLTQSSSNRKAGYSLKCWGHCGGAGRIHFVLASEKNPLTDLQIMAS